MEGKGSEVGEHVYILFPTVPTDIPAPVACSCLVVWLHSILSVLACSSKMLCAALELINYKCLLGHGYLLWSIFLLPATRPFYSYPTSPLPAYFASTKHICTS